MRTGQDPFNSAIQASLRKQMSTREARLTGRWPNVNPEALSAKKSTDLRISRMQEIRSGRYFQNNVIEKQVTRNRAAVDSYFQRKSAIDNQQ